MFHLLAVTVFTFPIQRSRLILTMAFILE